MPPLSAAQTARLVSDSPRPRQAPASERLLRAKPVVAKPVTGPVLRAKPVVAKPVTGPVLRAKPVAARTEAPEARGFFASVWRSLSPLGKIKTVVALVLMGGALLIYVPLWVFVELSRP